MQTQKQELRTLVRGAYDIQKLRIQMGNRIAANFKAKLGLEPSTKEEDGLDKEAQKILKKLRDSYSRITDGMTNFPRESAFKDDGLISTYTELCLVAEYCELLKTEEGHFRRLDKIVKKFPIWGAFLEGVKGVGPAMGGVIISEFDIAKARYASSLWRYAGLDVAQDGRGRSRRAEHLVTVKYTNKEGKEDERQSITFNPFLKTKLFVLAGSFLKQRGPYAAIYNDYKHRLESHPVHSEKRPGHRHNMAMRYMLKMFLADLYVAWRKLEGLEVAPSYQEAKLGHAHAA
jgi:hypothetical protein